MAPGLTGFDPALHARLDRQLARGAEALGVPLGDGDRAAVLAHLALLQRWNAVYNLTAVRDPQAMLVRHVLDSLAIVPLLPHGPAVDVGSGAGFPGVPVAVARGSQPMCLLDAELKRTRFLNQVCIGLGRANLAVKRSRCEHVTPTDPDWPAGGGFALVLARAVAPVEQFMAMAGHLCRPGGTMALMAGVAPRRIAPKAGFAGPDVRRVQVPGLSEPRHVVLIAREP